MGRFRSISLMLSVITSLLVVMLVSVLALSAVQAFHRQEKSRAVLANVKDIRQILSAAATVRNELALANLMLDGPRPASARTIARLEHLQALSETVLDRAISQSGRHDLLGSKSLVATLRTTDRAFRLTYLELLDAVRLPNEARNPEVSARWKTITTKLTRNLSEVAEVREQEVSGNDLFIDATLKVSDAAWNLRMDAGRERGVLQSAIIGNRIPSQASLEDLAELKGMVSAHWRNILASTRSNMPALIKQAVETARQEYFIHQMKTRDDLLRELIAGRRVSITGEQWVEMSDPGLATLLNIATAALNLCGERAVQLSQDAARAFDVAVTMMVLSLFLATISVACVSFRVVRPLKAITRSLRSQISDVDKPVPYENNDDEIGEFARALRSFRASAHEQESLKSELMRQRSAKAAAEDASRFKSEFLANMSHELRTPLNAILGFSEVMRLELHGPLGNPRYREYADDVHNSGAHLLDLINDILDLSKIGAGRLELKETDFSIVELMEEAVQMARQNNACCTINVIKGAEPRAIFADKRLLKQVLLNLLSNSIKFTPNGGEVSIEAVNTPQGMVLTVKDTGIGMDASDLEIAFLPYGQVDSKVARKHHGTGLGLPISRSLVELHGGSLTATSAKGAGTTMILHLPIARISQLAA